MNRVERLRRLREGGHTQRAHTLPYHGSYSVAEHSWNVATIIICLWRENVPASLLLAALMHDVTERWTGDGPGPAKWFNDDLDAAHKKAESFVENSLGIENWMQLAHYQAAWLKSCDVLELWLWSLDQINMGNRNAEAIKADCELWVSDHLTIVPPHVLKVFQHYKWKRTRDSEMWRG